MAVKITDICISCGSCIDECPVSAIVDDSDNPLSASDITMRPLAPQPVLQTAV